MGEAFLTVLALMLVLGVMQVYIYIQSNSLFLKRVLAHGGYGFPSRMWGLTLDHTVSVDLVLANGSLVTVTDHQHPDLFWVCLNLRFLSDVLTLIVFECRLFGVQEVHTESPLLSNSGLIQFPLPDLSSHIHGY